MRPYKDLGFRVCCGVARGTATAKPRKCRVAAALISYDTGAIRRGGDNVDSLARIEERKRRKAVLAEEEEIMRQKYSLPSSAAELEMRATGFFRSMFYGSLREIRGPLYDLMLLLYVGEHCDKQQQQRVTADFDAQLVSLAQRVRNGSATDAYVWIHSESNARLHEVRSFARSDYFLGPIEASRKKCKPLDFKVLTVDEVASLIHALHQPNSLLAKVMKPDPLLTHHENFHIAVEHARLFLLKSELPILFALDITYRDLANHVLKCGFPDCRHKGDTEETLTKELLLSAEDRFSSPWFPFPSSVEAHLRAKTIERHHQVRNDPSRRVQHLDPAECSRDAHTLVKRVMKTRRPYFVGGPHDKYRGWKEITQQLDGAAGPMEESEYWIYGEWTNESPELRALFMRC